MIHWRQRVRDITMPLIQWRARKYSYILSLAMSRGVNCEDTRECLDFFLEEAGLDIEDRVKSLISGDDCIEIYDRMGVQIFRSFNIYKVSSFTIDELETKRMDQLFERPEIFNQMLIKSAKKLFSQKLRFLTDFCPSHQVFERKENAIGVDIEYNFMVPVYDSTAEVVGVLVSERLRPLEVSLRSESLIPPKGANRGLQTLQN